MKGLFLDLVKTIKFVYHLSLAIILKSKEEAIWILTLNSPIFIKKKVGMHFLKKNQQNYLENLDQTWIGYLTELKENGFTKIPNFFNENAQIIFDSLTKFNFTSWKRDDAVIDFSFDLGFAHPGVIELMANENFCNLLTAYYGRQAYYREHPEILSHSESINKRSSEFIHVDGYRQITCFLMLSEMNFETSQLFLYPKTHQNIGLDLDRYPNRKITDVDPIAITANFGDLLVFDSGATWHFGVSRTKKRIILNLIVTTGWLPTMKKENYDNDFLSYYLRSKPYIVKETFSGFL